MNIRYTSLDYYQTLPSPSGILGWQQRSWKPVSSHVMFFWLDMLMGNYKINEISISDRDTFYTCVNCIRVIQTKYKLYNINRQALTIKHINIQITAQKHTEQWCLFFDRSRSQNYILVHLMHKSYKYLIETIT